MPLNRSCQSSRWSSVILANRTSGTSNAWPDDVAGALTALAPGHAFTVPEVLFAKISDESRAEWEERFKGVRT